MRCLFTLGALVVLSTGCTSDSNLPTLRTSGPDFFDSPWPSDRRTVGGKPDMSGFPGTEDYALVQTYLEQIEELDGFGTNSPIFIQLDGDISSLPTTEDTLRADDPLFLVDVDVNSPERGQIIPLTLRHQAEETTWQPADLVAVSPVLGFPLRPRTTYALVLTTDFIQPVEGFDEAWEPDSPEHSYYKELAETLVDLSVPWEHVAYAVRFTTQDPVSELARFSARIRDDLTVPALDQELPRYWETRGVRTFEGQMWIPLWQSGVKPYLTKGGNFVFDDEGRPEVQSWEQVTFTISLPADAEMPEDGWPVVIYGHGTGGDRHSFMNSASGCRIQVSKYMSPKSPAGRVPSVASSGGRSP